MQRSKYLLIVPIAALLLASCAPSGTPTPSIADLQATAMANAQTQIALTAAAMPSPTPAPTQIPPTPTQEVAQVAQQPTAIIIPTLQPTTEVSDVSAQQGNPCSGPLTTMKGPHVDMTVTNATKGPVDMYFYIYQTPFGCGYGHVFLEPSESDTISIPKGCYDFYGWVNGAKPSTPKGYACFNDNSPNTVKIKADTIETSY